MLKNYLKIAWRNLRSQKGYASINIIGLAVGLASCIIIMLYVSHELSYDKYNEKADRIYRIVTDLDFQGNEFHGATTPAPMGPTLERDFPEIEQAVRFQDRDSYFIRPANSMENRREEAVIFADDGVFDVFTLPMLYGNPDTALEDPDSIVLTALAAERHFGRTDVLGEALVLGDDDTYTIRGVIEEMPVTSHFRYDFFVSITSVDEANEEEWWDYNFITYLLLADGTSPSAFEQKFNDIKLSYMEAQLGEYMGVDFNQYEQAGNHLEFYLQPLTRIHLYSDLESELSANGSILYVYIFSGLALFILLLACINFMNLATARSVKRGKEVGVRRTLGSLRSQLTFQFLSESILISFIAFILALLLVEMALPFFSSIAGREIVNDYFSQPLLFLSILGIVVLTGLLAGSYPAIMLASFKPVNVLKGTYKEGIAHTFMRKGLVIFQFTVSIGIVVGLLVINRQLDFIQSRDLGFETDQVIVLQDAWALGNTNDLVSFRDQMISETTFVDGTVSGYLPVDGYVRAEPLFWPEGRDPGGATSVSIQSWPADEHYIPTMGMQLIDGRNFSEELDTYGRAVILTESAVERFQLSDPIGSVIQTYGGDPHPIVGVVKDFHFESLRETISPVGLFFGIERTSIAFKIASDDASQAINLLATAWSERVPMQPFSYEFLDQQFDQMYRAESRTRDLMTAFSVLAGLIACLGLFGLSAYSAERRTKEIGVRRVLGASIQSILALMSREFLQLILISFAIAVPVSWLVMSQWLQSFTYRTDIGLMTYVLAGTTALLVALLTVSWQSVRAAMKDPVSSLRTE